VSAIVFIALNGYDFEAPEDNFAKMVYATIKV
jgi:prophage maintenance system killer protein